MNDLQKKFAIVGLTAFIVWLILAIGNDAFSKSENFTIFMRRAIYANNPVDCTYCLAAASWPHFITFTTWLGSLIAFFISKD